MKRLITRLTTLLIVGTLLPFESGLICAQANSTREQITQQISRPDQKHPITLDEIISTPELHEPRISPDGTKIAFILKHAVLEKNENLSALYVLNINSHGEPVKLLEEKSLSQIKWMPDGKSLTYLSAKSGSSQVWRLDTVTATSAILFEHKGGVSRYEWSSDYKKIAFVSAVAVTAEERSQLQAEGIVFDEKIHSYIDSVWNTWIRKPVKIWIYDVTEQRERSLWEHASAIMDIVWAPDSKKLAVVYKPTTDPADNYRNLEIRYIGFISIESGRFTPLVTRSAVSDSPVWSPDSKSIAFLLNDLLTENSSRGQQGSLLSINLIQIEDGQPHLIEPVAKASNLIWAKNGASIIFQSAEDGRQIIYKKPLDGGPRRKLSDDAADLSECSFDESQARAACIRQDLTIPPEIAFVNLSNGTSKTLTAFNDAYRNILLGDVSELSWVNKYGNSTNGYLIKPVNYIPGRRYPLLVILYGFSRRFISQAQWNPNFPAQGFAGAGYVVLLMNPPRAGWRKGNFKEASFSRAYNPLASIEAAVQMLIDKGIADPKRKGIMGWSYGSFLTDFTITHTDLFEAASSGEGGGENPAVYSLATPGARVVEDSTYGGPPAGKSYRNWSEISPALNAHRVRIPVLMEYIHAVGALEFYTAMKGHGAQAELVLYPDETHAFFQPIHRFNSMRRNLEWFNYWLLGKADTDPSRASQYARWESMKQKLAKRRNGEAEEKTTNPKGSLD